MIKTILGLIWKYFSLIYYKRLLYNFYHDSKDFFDFFFKENRLNILDEALNSVIKTENI